jgi:uncharacterized protein
VEQRVSIITLGVRDVASARDFYERLGWHVGAELEETVFFPLSGSLLVLWSRDKLAEDSGVNDAGGWGGVTLAHNVGSREAVDDVLEQARAAGARIAKHPSETFYGGYAGVFLDPDGHPWEVAHNPGLPLGDDGRISLPAP